MFTIGPMQILLVLLIVLVLFGAKKLPEIGGGLGKAIRNFRKATTEPDEIDVTDVKKPENPTASATAPTAAQDKKA